ncbi:MAG TPA: endonuclease/exonuclease/phosphatase family protein [Verrucomicrobiae bacterium]|nr:endonuclease/exonuclease/phosphatase family protein [Verrucomicrobiae bacterium]
MKSERVNQIEQEPAAIRLRPGGVSLRRAIACLIVTLATCALSAVAGSPEAGGKKSVKFYQGNAYIGGSIEAPLALDPTDPAFPQELLQTVTAVYMQIVASDPPARMAGLAGEIAAAKPDIAALEEVYTIEQAPATAQGPGPFTVAYDYLQLLTSALEAKGAHYRVAVVSTEMDVTMPMIANLNPLQLAYARAIDHEVILVRTDLPPGYLRASNPQTGKFSTYLQIPALGLSVYRGWCSVDAFVRGERFRCICTHLEDNSSPAIQEAQGLELLAGPAHLGGPVVIAGDLNADPLDRTETSTYHPFIAAGFKDSWLTLNPSDPAGGLTWGHDPNLADPTTQFVYRIDFVLYRGNEFTPVAAQVLDPMLSLAQPPLWPSDHAALTTTFFLGNPKAIQGKAGLSRR